MREELLTDHGSHVAVVEAGPAVHAEAGPGRLLLLEGLLHFRQSVLVDLRYISPIKESK